MAPDFDVFLSYNSHDRLLVEDLGSRLRAKGLTVWFDQIELRPGLPWQEGLESGLKASKAVAVCVGASGLGLWEKPEMRAAINRAQRETIPVIPVLLPGCPETPQLAMFLEEMTWVDLRDGLGDEGLGRLIWGITGVKVQPKRDSSRPAPASPPRKEPREETFGVRRRQASADIVIRNPIDEARLMLKRLELLDIDLRTPSDLYFDSADVLAMILGFERFAKGQAFHEALFDSDTATVQCIAFAGWYGEISLLPMHSVELFQFLGHHFADPHIEGAWVEWRIADFLEAAGLKEISRSLESPRSEDWNNFAHRQAGHAQQLFKCLQSIRGGGSRHRLLDLKVRGALRFGSEGDLDRLLARKELAVFREALASFRPALSYNNFTDALALTHLCSLVERYEREELERLPLFLASSSLFARVLEVTRLESQLHSRRAGVGALRDAGYLLLRAIFVAPGGFGPPREVREILSVLRSLVGDMENIGDLPDDRSALTGTLDDLRLYRFFENVWLPSVAKDHDPIRVELAELAESVRRLRDPELARRVSAAVADLRMSLDGSVAQYRLAMNLFSALEKSLIRAPRAETVPQAHLALDLVPIGVSPENRTDAARIAHGLAEDSSFEGARDELLRRCMHSMSSDRSGIEVVLAVLWLLHLDGELLDVIVAGGPPHKDAGDLTVRVLQAAALVGLGRRAEAADVQAGIRSDTTGRVELALAFLARLDAIEGEENRGLLPSLTHPPREPSEVHRAVQLAQKAVSQLEPASAEWVCAHDLVVNALLDFPASERNRYLLAEEANILLRARATSSRWWHPRYDFTIARVLVEGTSRESLSQLSLFKRATEILSALPEYLRRKPTISRYLVYVIELEEHYKSVRFGGKYDAPP